MCQSPLGPANVTLATKSGTGKSQVDGQRGRGRRGFGGEGLRSATWRSAGALGDGVSPPVARRNARELVGEGRGRGQVVEGDGA